MRLHILLLGEVTLASAAQDPLVLNQVTMGATSVQVVDLNWENVLFDATLKLVVFMTNNVNVDECKEIQ